MRGFGELVLLQRGHRQRVRMEERPAEPGSVTFWLIDPGQVVFLLCGFFIIKKKRCTRCVSCCRDRKPKSNLREVEFIVLHRLKVESRRWQELELAGHSESQWRLSLSSGFSPGP